MFPLFIFFFYESVIRNVASLLFIGRVLAQDSLLLQLINHPMSSSDAVAITSADDELDQITIIKSTANTSADELTGRILLENRALQSQKYEDFLVQYSRGEFDPGHIPALPLQYTDRMFLAPRPPDIWEKARQKHAMYYRLLRGAQTPPALLTQLEKITHFVKHVYKTNIVAVSLISDDTWVNQCGINFNARQLHRDITLCGHAILQRDDNPLVVLDTLQDWRFKNYPQCKNGLVRFYVGVPLISRTNKLNEVENQEEDNDTSNFAIGTLCIGDPQPRTEFSEEDSKNLRYCANLVMSEIDFYLCQQQVQEQQCRTSVVAEFARTPIESFMTQQNGTSILNESIEQTLTARAVQRIKALYYDSTCHSSIGWPAHYLKENEDEETNMTSSALHRRALLTSPLDKRGSRTYNNNNNKKKSANLIQVKKHQTRLTKYVPPVDSVSSDSGSTSGHRIVSKRSPTLSAIVVPISSLSATPDTQPHHASSTSSSPTPAAATTYLVITAKNSSRVYDRLDADFLTLFANAITVFIQQRMLHRLHMAKDVFLATMSDQLRTPIHGMNGLTDILLESEDTNANQRNLLQIMQLTGQSLVSIVNNILNFKDLQNIRLDDKAQDEVNVHTILQEVLDAHAALMVSSMTIQLEDTLAPETEALLAPDFFQQILNHLVSNAIKFTHKGVIHVRMYKSGERGLTLEIEDSGRGMSADFITHQLYQPFTRENKDVPGIGIGLALCQKYAQAMHAYLTLNWSIPGEGSLFKLELPDVLLDVRPERNLSDSFTIQQFSNLYNQFHVTQNVAFTLPGNEKVHETIWLPSSWLLSSQSKIQPLNNFIITLVDARDVEFKGDQVKKLSQQYKQHGQGATFCFVTTELMVQYVELGNLPQTYFVLTPCGPIRYLTTLHTALQIELERLEKAKKDAETLKLEACKLSASDVSALIVDDNAVNRTILSMYFKKRKLPYTTANDGLEAVATFEKDHAHINLILMDYEMPNCDGPSAIKMIRKFEKDNNLNPVVIIMVTGLATNETKEYCLKSGASSFFLKPINLKDIDKLINKFFS